MLIWGMALAAAIVATGWLAWRGWREACLVLVAEALLWLELDQRFEGPHLFRLTPDHGFVVSDLVAIGAVAWALVSWRRLPAGDRVL
jgi:hypothetical protein